MKKFKFKLQIIVFIFFLSSCGNDDVVPAIENETLISSELFLTRTASDLQTFLGAGSIDIDIAALQHDVEIYKITYKTDYKGETITASGIVILPKTTDEVSMVSFQHGTITANSEAPSMLALSSTELLLYAGLASPGFIGVAPDFIGFGASSDIMHPYYVESLTASSVIDNLKAARELALEKGVTFNGDLFLAGYSQGGYATMATHKSIEQNGLDNFNLIASFPASGGYDVKAMQEYFFDLDSYHNPYYMAYVAHAYKTTFDWNEPLSDFFQEPYASRIPGLFNGSNTSSTINTQLTTNVADLLTTDIRINFDSSPNYDYLENAFIENGLVDWKPTIKMFMYHGDADITVPFQNSVITYNKLIDNGTSTSILQFLVIEGGTHSTGVIPYIEDFIPKMLELK
ncbi:MAG: hypothetical protein KDC93_10420 [Cyclobacteriaceae bacterium]|nr:hypothetical protein [Cyclobacteriaceae bacterium]